MKKAIIQRIENLDRGKLQRVSELIDSLETPIKEEINPKSDLMSDAFLEEFRSRLLIQHIFLQSPLFQDTFDQAFISAASAAGLKVKEANDGERFWDVSVNERTVSLKSTKEKALKENKLKISKLTEAAWIQDCRSAKQRRDGTFSLFRDYCDRVNTIFQLRYFHKFEHYELIEIPANLFEKIFTVPLDSFRADGPSINIPVGQVPPDFTLKLDRSDAKITLNNIRKEICITHGSWTFN